ncbi:MAG: hypothetical protein JWO32_1100 [Bacteroidetes bacterium]|nr:hypothetical protein [Bacteroidota bacterium]
MPAKFFIIALFISLVSPAQNNLRLYTGTGIPFTLSVADSAVNKKPEVDVLLEKINDDSIKITIVLENKLTAKETVFLLEKGKPVKNKEFKYLVELKKNKIKISYSGIEDILPLPSPLVPPKPVIDTSYKLKNNVLGHYCELKEGKAVYFNNIPKKGECLKPMAQTYVSYMNALSARAEVEDDKYKIFENTCLNNCISVSQLNQMLLQVNFEIEKLKLIRLAYSHIVDKGNKAKLDSTFKLESSKNELAVFFKNISEHKIKAGTECMVASGDKEINQFCETLSVYSNDTERFNTFKKTYSLLCYSTAQVKLVLNQFIHDREKLEVAKLLYYHCTDNDNFMSVTEVFSYNTTAADLKDFVSKQKN